MDWAGSYTESAIMVYARCIVHTRMSAAVDHSSSHASGTVFMKGAVAQMSRW